MTNDTAVSDRIGAAVREVRTSRPWRRADLAGRCAAAGAPGMTATVIYDIESGRPDAGGRRRRLVSADELVALALALDVAPVHLVIPLGDDEPCPLTASVTVPAIEARPWF